MPCYLLHFDRPLGNLANPRGQAQHYLGSTVLPVETRIKQHLSGTGAKITRAAVRKGISLNVVRVWNEGDRDFERSLKELKKSKLLCPICNPTIDLRVKKLMLIKELEQQIQAKGAIEVLAALCDALETTGEKSLSEQIREILFYATI